MTSSTKEIPLDIDHQEVLVRCIGNDLYYSMEKGRLASTAFMPPPKRNDVSLLRLSYTTLDFCKKHAQSIKKKDYNYLGLAVTVCQDFINLDTEKTPLTEVVASPLDENLELVKCKYVYVSDKGVPSHADLIYCDWQPTEGKNAPNYIKKIARRLSKNPPTPFFKDNNPQSSNFENEDITEYIRLKQG